MHEVPVNRLGGLNLLRKSAVRLPDRPDMTLDVYRGPSNNKNKSIVISLETVLIYKHIITDQGPGSQSLETP